MRVVLCSRWRCIAHLWKLQRRTSLWETMLVRHIALQHTGGIAQCMGLRGMRVCRSYTPRSGPVARPCPAMHTGLFPGLLPWQSSRA